MKKIFITTLGCKVNQYESASFLSDFEKEGCLIVSDNDQPDIVVINTCTVTGKAGSQSRQLIRQAAKKNPGAKIIVTGCHAQMAAGEIIEMDEINQNPICVVGNGNKHLLVKIALNEKSSDLSMLMGKISHKKEICDLPVTHFGGRTRAFLKVQDGCSSFCTYCIVPYTRGPSRSLAFEKVLNQALSFSAQGYKEIVVTGIHIGLYGRDLSEGHDIVSLMEKLCQATPNIHYRLSSIEPLEINTELLDLMADQANFMPHLHIPLQSGDDTILKRMNRRYTTQDFKKVVKLCRSKLPDAAIGIDVLVGFPGESKQSFEKSLSFIQELDCTYLHVFPYSKRPGTLAATYDNQIEKKEKQRRVTLLRQLGDEKKKHFYDRSLQSEREVLVESKKDLHGNLKGFTDNYIPVHFSGDDDLINHVVNVCLTERKKLDVFGTLVGATS